MKLDSQLSLHSYNSMAREHYLFWTPIDPDFHVDYNSASLKVDSRLAHNDAVLRMEGTHPTHFHSLFDDIAELSTVCCSLA